MDRVIFNPQLKLLWHWDKINAWLKSGDTVPVLVEVSPTNYCNANCPWCFYIYEHCDAKNESKKKHISREAMLKTLADMRTLGVKAINWTGGGEPTLHPNFNEFSEAAYNLGYSQGIFTNALDYNLNKINPKHFEWIRISVTNKGITGIDTRLLKHYREASPETTIGVCLSLIKSDYDKLPEMVRQARDLGFNYFQVRPALQKSYKNQEPIDVPYHLKEFETPDFKVFLSEYKFDESTKPKSYDICYGHFFCPAIDYRGEVNVCMYRLSEDDYVMGNIHDQSFIDIWNSAKRKLIKNRKLVDANCQNCCKNHEINKVLYHIKHPDRHSNIDFI